MMILGSVAFCFPCLVFTMVVPLVIEVFINLFDNIQGKHILPKGQSALCGLAFLLSIVENGR